jgi:hypothetical protein
LPNRWHCNCEQGKHYGPVAGSFLGLPGRICKHVAACALAWSVAGEDDTYLPPLTEAGAVFKLVGRLVEANVAPTPGNSIDIPSSPAKLKRRKDDEVLVLSAHRRLSGPVARLVTVYGQTNRHQWEMPDEAQQNYRKWVAELAA